MKNTEICPLWESLREKYTKNNEIFMKFRLFSLKTQSICGIMGSIKLQEEINFE